MRISSILGMALAVSAGSGGFAPHGERVTASDRLPPQAAPIFASDRYEPAIRASFARGQRERRRDHRRGSR